VDQPSVVAAFSYMYPILSTMKEDSFFFKTEYLKAMKRFSTGRKGSPLL
jgi:hypothetical protein